MIIHQKIVDFCLQLGYPNARADGVCHGLSIRWLEACLLGEEEVFSKRLIAITNGGKALIQSIKMGKRNKWQGLTPEKRAQLFDIMAFFDSLELYHAPFLYNTLFNTSLSQHDIKLLSTLASSEKIQSQGGLSQIYSEPGIYTQAELEQYLKDLGKELENPALTTHTQKTFGAVLADHEHTLALTYTPHVGWKLMDINQYPPIAFSTTQTAKLVEKIATGFCCSKNQYIAFNTTLIIPGNSNPADSLPKRKQTITSGIAKRSVDGVGLAYIAAQNGHASVIAELAKHGADFNNAAPNGVTPGFIAAQNGHASVIAELAKHHADFDRARSDDTTPAFIAAQNGHASVIAELAKHGADFNNAAPDGATPVFIAAQKGHVDVVIELIKSGANLDICLKSSAESLTEFAETIDDASSQRMALFIGKHSLEESKNILIPPQKIAELMGHKDIAWLIEHAKLVRPLLKSIDSLRQYGKHMSHEKDKLSEQEAQKAILLAENLEREAKRYLLNRTSRPSNSQPNDFKKLLDQGYKEMHHRAAWKYILFNIAIAATGIGLLVLLGHYIKTKAVFFQETTRQRNVKQIEDTLSAFNSHIDVCQDDSTIFLIG